MLLRKVVISPIEELRFCCCVRERYSLLTVTSNENYVCSEWSFAFAHYMTIAVVISSTFCCQFCATEFVKFDLLLLIRD